MGQMRTREVRVREIELLRKLSHENVVTLVAEEFEVLIDSLCEKCCCILMNNNFQFD